MTKTNASQAAEDRATYDLWTAAQVVAYEAAGNTHWYSSTKALRMKRRGGTAPRDPFTGPFWALKPWLVQEAIDWFEVSGNPRYTFTDWQRMQREQRSELAAYDAEASSPLSTLEYMRDLMDRRPALIAEARAEGASWADITTATGLSRMQAHSIAKLHAVEVAAAVEVAETVAAYVVDTSNYAAAGYASAAAMVDAETPF